MAALQASRFAACLTLAILAQLCVVTLFVMPPTRSLRGTTALATTESAQTDSLTARQFFGGNAAPEAPPAKSKPKQKPFTLPPFFTTGVALTLLAGLCYYFLANGNGNQ